MKHTFQCNIYLWIAAIFVLISSSCSSDEPRNEELSGTWYGTHYYINNGSVKYQYITLILNPDKTGTMEYESPVSFSAAKFVWSVNKDILICNGAYANTSGEVSGNYRLECRIENSRLIPINHYNVFILTKDNSIITDGNGEEITNPDDQLNTLQNVWVEDNRESVIIFYPNGKYEEYILSKPGDNYYSKFYVGTYRFEPFQKHLIINTTIWDILKLAEDNLILKNGNKQLKYHMGTKNDIPKQSDLKAYLSSTIWIDKKGKYLFTFKNDGTVSYFEYSGKRYGSFGEIVLRADGNYSVNGSTVTCRYSDVSWEYGSSGTSKWFPGWTYGVSCTKTYKVEVTPSSGLMITFPDSNVVYFDKV